MLKIIFIAGGMAFLATCFAAAADDKPPTDYKEFMANLKGEYSIVSGEKFGKEEPAERIKGTMVRFTQDTVIVVDKDKKQTYAATYKIDPSKKPMSITMTSIAAPNKGETATGLIALDGGKLKLIYALPKGEAPTDFKTKDQQLMFVMEKASK